jgi:hypothetical protein
VSSLAHPRTRSFPGHTARADQNLAGETHVFGEAFGGRATVRTHPDCNSDIGGGPEGRLHGGRSLINFVASVQGLSATEVPGKAKDGTELSTDFAARRTSLARPEVEIAKGSEVVNLRAVGRPEHLQKILRDWRKAYGDQVPLWEDLTPEQRASVEQATQAVEIGLSLSLPDAEAFAVKAALGAGVLAFGEGFAGSQLAESLRNWASTPFDNPLEEGSTKPRHEIAMLDALDASLGGQAAQMSQTGMEVDLPPIVPDQGSATNQATFVPLPGKPATAVFVHILGFPIPPYGLQVEGELPKGELGLAASPVVVREVDGRLKVINVMERLMRPVIEAARRAEEEMRAEEDE